MCEFCTLTKIKDEPTRIHEFPNSVAYVDYEQKEYPGSAILILKKHYDHAHEIPAKILHAFMNERTLLAKALLKIYPKAIRINYANLGNGISHVHEYLVVRYPDDPNNGKSPWPITLSKKLNPKEYQAIANKIAKAL